MELTFDDIVSLLKEKGYRLTENRLAIIKILFDTRHITFNDLVAKLEETQKNVNIMSVYNSLEVLKSEHIIFTNTFDGKHIWYDLVSNPSMHLICDMCHKILHVDNQQLLQEISLEGLITPVKKAKWIPIHFKIEAHGFCEQCQKKQKLVHNHFVFDID